MPRAPLHVCAEPGCPTLCPRGKSRCDVHRRERWRDYERTRRNPRPELQRLYRSKRWQIVRGIVLQAEPCCRLCAEAGRRLVPASVVDHITPAAEDPERFFDTENLRPLCASCHNRVTMTANVASGVLRMGKAAASD